MSGLLHAVIGSISDGDDVHAMKVDFVVLVVCVHGWIELRFVGMITYTYTYVLRNNIE